MERKVRKKEEWKRTINKRWKREKKERLEIKRKINKTMMGVGREVKKENGK